MKPEIEKAVREATAGKNALVMETDYPEMPVAAFRSPESAEWLAYRISQSGSKEEKAGAAKPLVIRCRLYPDAAPFEAALKAHPGLVESFVNELVDHAGIGHAKKVVLS